MISSRARWRTLVLLFAGFFAVAVYIVYSKESALHALPYGFKKFSLSDPLPLCGRWKEHMPLARDPEAYKVYIEARRLWRSKIGWQLTRAE